MFGVSEAAQRGAAAGGGLRGAGGARGRRPRAPGAAAAKRQRRRRAAHAPAAAPPCRCWPPPPRCAARTASTRGAVVVFDDLTELLKAQRLAAWREVAQRIAHEIKNPLTPIQLSAQRLRRRLGWARRRGPAAGRRVHGDDRPGGRRAEAAGRRVLALRAHARLRAPAHGRAAARRERGRALPRVASRAARWPRRHADDLPLLEVDPDHIKRAVLNLVDNAVEAVGAGPRRGGGGDAAPARGRPRAHRGERHRARHPRRGPRQALPAALLDEGDGHGAGPAHRERDRRRARRHASRSRTTSRAAAASSSSCRWPARPRRWRPERGRRAHPHRRRRAGHPDGAARTCSRTRATG